MAHEPTTGGMAAPSPLDLSVAIVCKNNENTIERTLAGVQGLASEIVAVDSGSTDHTLALLEHHGARVIHSEWLGHIRTKQKALDLCTRQWVLCLDSDESLEEDLRRSIRKALTATGGRCGDGFFVNRRVWYAGGFLNYAWQPEWRLRLVRRGCASWGGMDPHDKLALHRGAGGRLEGTLRHDSFTSFEEQFRKQVGYARISAEGLAAAGARGSVWRLATSPMGAFLKQIIIKRAFLDGWAGWAAATAAAANAATKHAILLDLTRRAEREGKGTDGV